MFESVSPEQIMVIGLLATLAAQAFKLYMTWSKRTVHRKTITVFMFVVSMVVGYLWSRPAMPTFPALPAVVDDPAVYAALIVTFIGQVIVFLGQLVALVSAMVGFATGIYNLLLAKVFELLGWDVKQIPSDSSGSNPPEQSSAIGG